MAKTFLASNGLRSICRLLLLAMFILPWCMLAAWYFSPKRQLVIAILDKTVTAPGGKGHVSLDWVLNHEKFSKNDNSLYRAGQDYYGFFPEENEKFQVKGLERFNPAELGQLSDDVDAAYFADTYGIFKNEWYKNIDAKEQAGIVYGGMSPEDIYLLKQLQSRHKLIITEFNCLGSPTPPGVRNDFENMFGIKWTGWTGRYFDSFDTLINKEIPNWLINNYKNTHDGRWPFKESGIVFVNEDERVVILENRTHLRNEHPTITASGEGQQHYGMTKKIHYVSWFDIIDVNTEVNQVISSYGIDANEEGKKELAKNQIPESFPAILAHINTDYRFFYFAGDFCDNTVKMGSSYFRHSTLLKSFMYDSGDPHEKARFFWELYRPLVTTILNDYYLSLRH